MRVDLSTTFPIQIIWTRASDFIELTKPRIAFLVLFISFVGFYCGVHGPLPLLLLFHTLIGTALVAGGAGAFNMYLERGLDATMKRTALRPLAAGRLKSRSAFLFAAIISIAGFVYLFIIVNHLTAFLSIAILAGYLFLYTPLKRKTWLCTLIGAVPGALPIILGWTGASGSLSSEAWALFAIVFLWQLPHFYSIGWMYREEYARAGVPILSVIDSSGARTGRQAVFCIILLMFATTAPFFLGLAGIIYVCGAIALGLLFLAFGLHFAHLRNRLAARRLFIFSAIYLPTLLTLLLFDIS
jgi:protoheme IX farnesyltransferase